ARAAVAPLAGRGAGVARAGGRTGPARARRRPVGAGPARRAAAGHPPRAAAPGAAADRHQARALVQPARTGLPHRPPRTRRRCGRRRIVALTAPRRNHRRDRRATLARRQRRLRLRQRDPAPSRAATGACDRAPPRIQRRLRRFHCRWRLRDAHAVAERWLGHGGTRGLASPAVLACGRRARVHPGRLARTRSARARVPPEPLRGRRLRALGRRAPAHRSRVGSGRLGLRHRRQLRRRPGAAASAGLPGSRGGGCAAGDVRRRLGMDLQRLRALARLPPAARHPGRIQRQVHERPAGAARRQLRHAARARAHQLPQLLRPARALAVLGAAPCKGHRLSSGPELTDLHPSTDDIAGDVLRGLASVPKRLPSKYFYDQRGAELFEAITRQPEYYLTRVELALLADRGAEIAAAVGPRAHVVEPGSGSGRKTRLLLDALDDPVAYTPIDISRAALTASAGRLDREFGDVEVLPVLAGFTRAVPLPTPARPADSALVFFPGSTLGNFTRDESVRLLGAMRATMGDGGAALLGLDLEKDPALLEAAYNDAAGVTAEFTLNLLRRLN